MVRTLLQGPAGSGKTRRVLDAVRPLLAPSDGGAFRRFLVLVPTYSQAEHLKRRLLREAAAGGRGPVPGGLLDRGVVTFEQLAERRTGIRLQSLAPAAVRDGLLAAAFAEADDPAFRDVARFPGFRRAALRFLDEVKALEPDPSADVVAAAADRIAAASGTIPGSRAPLVRALVGVLAVYERRRLAEGLRDHGDLLRELLRLLRAPAAPGAGPGFFAMDGFTDLTPVQEAIVHRLSAAASESLVTLLAEPEEGEASPFAAGAGLRERLVAAGFRVETIGGFRRAGGDLARLERRVAGHDAGTAPGEGSVEFLAGADPDDEADRVARTVLRWTTSGIARPDVLVVVRSTGSDTASRIAAALRRHGVPFHRFGGERLAAVPCVRSALRAFRLLSGEGAADRAAEDLVAAVRQGDAAGVEDRDADRVAEAVRVRGATSEDDVANLARDAGADSVLDWLARLRDRRIPRIDQPPARLAEALFASLPDLVALRWLRPFDDADEEDVARDAAALRALRDLAGDLVRALRAAGESSVAPGEFAARLESAADAAQFTRRDARDDVVHVVGAEEARQWEARAVVVAGLRLGEFPAAGREDLFLSDDERAAVAAATGLRLPTRIDETLRRERLLFYAAVTRARERLALTCPVSDDGGNPVLRSPFLDLALTIRPPEARRLDGAGRTPGDVRPAPGETFHRADLERTALAALTERFAEGDASEVRPHTGYALLPDLVARPGSPVRTAARWFLPPAASLREDGAARAALARPRPRSASSLAEFAQCPYRHFARKGLGLEERAAGLDDGLDALTAGEIAHRFLEDAVRRRLRDPAAAAALLDDVFRREAGGLRRDLRLERARRELHARLVPFVVSGDAEAVVPGFGPAHFEWKFGMAGGPPVAVGGGRVQVAGAADRIDVDGTGRAVVLDYKWSKSHRYHDVEGRIEGGLDLQLPIYAIAARRALGLRVVAVAWLPLRDMRPKWLRVTSDAPVRGSAPDGWGEGDGSEGLARAEAWIVEHDRRIRSGAIEAAPVEEDRCGSRCPFADLCRFEGEAKPRDAAPPAPAAEDAP